MRKFRCELQKKIEDITEEINNLLKIYATWIVFAKVNSDGSECVSKDCASLNRESQSVFLTLSREPTHVFRSLTADIRCLLFLYRYQSRFYGKRASEIFEEHVSDDISFSLWDKQFLCDYICVDLEGRILYIYIYI